MVDYEIDLRGTECPMNVIIAKVKMKEVHTGKMVRIIVDFPAAYDDVPQALKNEGYKIISMKKLNEKDMEIIVQKT